MRRLRLRSVCTIEPGLTGAESERIEREFGFEFAADHRAFLAAGLPVNAGRRPPPPGVIEAYAEPWPDWRHGDPDRLRGALDRPREGVLFDVEKNGFWYDAWGPRPDRTADAVATATAKLRDVPTLVPVHGHRYLPAGRSLTGHPVLSVWQTDIIFYGVDLADYIDHEFGGATAPGAEPVATVDFWRDLV
ncbi:hypothetical protein AB0F81_43390 [Actinoplanes sp. NPDC024001]|uniref:hypothetical protein n=1 Tax=Actinoplanes sp. NPDC024001 TaxID=3154598 RepID=UPI00340B685F